MLRSLALVCLVAANLTTFAARADEPAAGKQVAQSATLMVDRNGETAEVEMRYWLFLPQSYGNKDDKFPLMLFLHGAGERGSELELVKKHGPPMLVDGQPDFRFVLVSPQCPKDTRWDAAELAKLVEHVANTFRVDRQRMYVTGLSMGGSGTWSLLAEHPNVFAAGVPICGRGDMNAAATLAKTPLWAVIGGKDKPDLVADNKSLMEAVEKAGGRVRFTLYPDAGHNSWTETYNNPAVYDWLLQQKTE